RRLLSKRLHLLFSRERGFLPKRLSREKFITARPFNGRKRWTAGNEGKAFLNDGAETGACLQCNKMRHQARPRNTFSKRCSVFAIISNGRFAYSRSIGKVRRKGAGNVVCDDDSGHIGHS